MVFGVVRCTSWIPQTLDVQGVIHTDESNFGLSSNTEGNVLFMSNSLNPAVARRGVG